MPFLKFPDGFQWGVATAAYQIEGAVSEDDRGVSVWDTYCRQPGRVERGETGDVAADHYHRYKDDIALMKRFGVQTYRFSVAWPRVIPYGKGAVNEKGLDFYDRLVDELLRQGIQPALTLYHWDLPQSLQDLGGWANRDVTDWFAAYADAVYRRLGDRVERWITLNEPTVFVMFGHRYAVMAPGIKDAATTARVTHHALLAHGKAVQAFRASGAKGEIGMTNANTFYEPADASPETAIATELARDFDGRLWHGPIFGKGYPASVVKYYAERGAPLPIQAGDMEIIAEPTDFLGLNLYSRQLIKPDDNPRGTGFQNARPTLRVLPMGYEAAPHALGAQVRWLTNEYGKKKIYITENGVGDDVHPDASGVVDDQERIELVRAFLAGLQDAIADGCDVRGYYLWSFMDNFEWSYGYRQRFGMVYTDFETQRRIPKKSADFFAKVARENGVDGVVPRTDAVHA